ncbi:LPD11 domain-containing protein [Bifidobacterium adolescentis]|jgi:N12 class adenine-specific DNA methylase|uniref:LPD11 domain-containing protein n=1 Tax=Bifidobacterium adolescentis TaxID=1680 RepID=UPI00244E6199|nr:LPD11 domain-containing protein [Bifidobacterium adolescentis]WGJ16811.1 DEAD/DEAH box helicase family protein [Bifidobacterium adolescentis]
MDENENTSQTEDLWQSDDWADLRWARKHSTPQQIARHLLDPQWRGRDYNALDELVEMTHDADLSSLDEDDLETLAASGLPELRQAVIRYAGTPARLLEDMARTESNTRLLQMLVESGKLSQNTIDLCCWNQTDSRLAASMLTKASDDLLHRLSGRDWWPSRKNAVESGRLDRARLSDMIKTENHPDVVSALIGTGEFDMDSEAEAIRRVITSPGLLTAYTNPMNRRYSLDQSRREVVRQAARTMLEHAPVGMILSMPDDDDENWRTLIDTAATEYAGELGKDMLGLIAQSEGNTQARTILAGRGFPKAAASNAERTLAASPGADGTYGFNLRLLGRLKDDVDYFLGPSHAEKYLWAGSVDAQIAKLREIDGTIRPEDRPEWFTTEWIDQAEREMKDPSDNTGTALDAALSGQYAAFENAVIGYIDAHDTDAGTSENGASQFAGYEVAARDANGTPMAYRLDWFDDEGMVHEGPEATETELRSLREGIFDSPDSWDSFNTATDTPDTTAADTSGTAGTKPGHETGHGPQIVFTSLAGGHGMPEGTVELLSDDAARQVSDILDAGGTSGGRPERAAGQDRERRRENIDRLLDVLPVTMVTKDGNHQVTAEEVMAMADRTEHAADMAEEPETAAASSTDTPAEPFDWNGVDGLESGIRDWYSHEFPDDPEGGRIDPRTTFREAVESFPMGDGHDFYAVTGAVDSIVRERVFEELSKRLDCGYGTVYDAWLHHTGLDPDLLGTKSTHMRHDIEDMLGASAGSYATVDAIADHMAADRHLRSIIREADRSTAIGSRDFEKGLGSAVADHPRIGRLMDDDRFKDLIYDMVHDGRRFSTPVQDDAIVSGADAPAAEAGTQSEAGEGRDLPDSGDGLASENVAEAPEPVVAATIEAEQLAFDFDDMPSGLDSRQNRGENYSQTKLGTVSNSDSSHETEENDAKKETTRNDEHHALPVHRDQEDEVPVHGGAHAGTAQGAPTPGDAGDGRLHGRDDEEVRPREDRVHQPLGQDAPTPQEAGQLGSVAQGTQDGGTGKRGSGHQGSGRSPLRGTDRGLLDPDRQTAGSNLERARANVHAIEVLRDLDESGREPTDDDIRALAAYAGWGGAQEAFQEDTTSQPWLEVNGRLRELLSDEEYADARSSTLTAFYTPRPLIDAIWNTLGKAGFGRDPKHPDMVLEPGCGTGNFIRSTPAGSSYGFTGIEADPISAGIARYLCPDDDIIANRMERTGLPESAFDLAVGNVPYSDAIRIDNTVIHDWFIRHSLDTVRPGGLVAVLTSRYTLDKNTTGMRRELARKAELVAACRLPRETFGRQAGTEVVSDILVLRKRDEPLADVDAAWVDAVEFSQGVNANRLFVEHPEYVAGTMTVGSGPFGPQIDVTGTNDIGRLGENVERILTGQLEAYGIGLHDRLGERANEPIVVPDATRQTAMRYTVDENGHIWYGNMYGQVVPAHSRVRNGGDERMAAMLRLRDRTERLLSSERDPETDDETVAQGIRDLDQAYDRFVESYGRLNSKENLRVFDPNATDASLNQLYALEKTNADGFEAKGDTLSKRVVTPTPPMPDHVDEPVEALSISLDRMGHVDLDLIGRLLGTRDTAETSERLGDLIVAGPDSGEPVPADEYLSGDVGGKIDHVEWLLRDLAGRPEHDRTNDWLAQNGLDDGSLEPAVSVEQAVRELRQSGAWQSATDPLHTTKAMVEEAWFADVSDAHNGQKMAMASKFIDDCKPGVELLAKNWDADNPQGNALFGSVFEQGWSGDGNGIANSTMRMLYKAVTADPEAIDDRVVATILNTRDFRWGDAKETLQKITDPSLWKVEDLGYRRESRCDLLAMARELRSHPEICEYLYSMDVARLKSPSHHGRYDEYRPLSSMVSVEGLGQWRERRNEWMEAHPAQEPDPERLMELRNLESRLRKSLPDRLTHDEITAKLGSSWIPAGVIRDFMIDTFKIRQRPDITEGGLRSLSVSHDETTGNWQVKSSLSPKLDETTIQEYGLGTGPGRNPFEIVAGALNSTTSNLTKPDPNDPTGKRKVRDPQATAMLYQKRHAVEQAFTEWVWNDPDRTRMLENVYNQRFNRIRPREYDGSYLTFPGISSDIDLYGHQRKAVARILQSEEGTLIAHVVGAGKTFTGVAACHEAKRLGKATKPMIVVPNHLTEQWAKDFLTLYPDANILSMTEADGAGKGAARFWAKVAGGDWDAVIVRQDTFQRMHVSPERRQRYFDRRKSEMLKSIETAKTDGNDFAAKKLKDEIGKMEKNLSKTVKQNEKDRARVDGKLQALRGGENNKDWIDFEDLGADMLFVDEAHQYKNLAIATTISVPGVDVAAAQKCEDLFDKCEYLRDQGRGANIVFATGTPVSNSMAELYNMQRYLAPGLLKAQGVEAFTSWANTYGSIVESVEVKPEGSGYQIKQRFSKFHNLPELMSTFHNYADLLTADKLDLDVPDCDVIPVAVEPTESQKKAVEELVQRAEVVKDGGVDPSDDNMLNITNDGRKVSLDPKLLDVSDPDVKPMEHGKVQVCAENIYRIWKEHAADKATQLVFCDSSTTASGKWNIQSDLKRRIMEQGIPEDEIMFAAQEKDPQKKQALFDKVRKGEVRVLIGSTGTLGTGTNVQDRLFAIHDLDCPWKPAELEQRQGRVRRQGNMFDKVEDYRYVTVGTFDSYMFQTVERKAGFISQIMNSDSPAREASDVDDTVLNLAQMKALATGDPKIAERMEAENRLTQLTLLKRAHAAQQKSIRFKIDMQLQPTVDSLEVQHAEAVDDEPAFRKAAALREEYRERGVCGLDLGNGPITDRKQAIHDLTGIARRLGHGQTVEAGEYCGMTVVIENRDMRVKGLNAFHPVVGLKDRHVHWSGNGMPDINNSADNVINQLGRIISGNTDTAQSLGVRLENAKADLDNAWTALSRPWSGQKEYDELTDRIAKMDMEIKGRPAQQQDDMEDGMQADLAEATFRSNGQEGAQTADDPSYPSDFPAMDMDEPEIPVPDPCVDPGSGMQDGPGLSM